MVNPRPSTQVKSAGRVLQVLEHFAGSRSPATVKEISERLGMPQSSTSVLLASMEAGGYLAYETATRQYRPTIRVMLLGAWMHDELFGEGSIISMMTSLRRRPRQSVMLGLRQGLFVRYLLSLRSAEPLSSINPTGTLGPVCISAIGKVLLADESDRALALLARRANMEVDNPANCVRIPEWLGEMRKVKETGWAECRNYPYEGIGGVAIKLPAMANHPPLAISLGVTMQRLGSERESLIEQLCKARAQFAGTA